MGVADCITWAHPLASFASVLLVLVVATETLNLSLTNKICIAVCHNDNVELQAIKLSHLPVCLTIGNKISG